MSRKKKSNRWIQEAVKRPGALREQAKREGAIDQRTGTIKREWLERKARRRGTTGRRARLALTLRKLRKRRRSIS